MDWDSDWDRCIYSAQNELDRKTWITFKAECRALPQTQSLLVAEVCNLIRTRNFEKAKTILESYKETTQEVEMIERPEDIDDKVTFSETNKFSAFIGRLEAIIQTSGSPDSVPVAGTEKSEFADFIHTSLFDPIPGQFSIFSTIKTAALYPSLDGCNDAYFQMYYEYIRISAILDRRRDMLVCQALEKRGQLEAYYPRSYWFKVSAFHDSVSIPKAPPSVVRSEDIPEKWRTILLIDEIDALTDAKRLVNRMIFKYQQNLTWKPGYPMDVVNSRLFYGKLLYAHVGKDDTIRVSINLFLDRPMNDINHTVKNFDAQAWWDKEDVSSDDKVALLAGSLEKSDGNLPHLASTGLPCYNLYLWRLKFEDSRDQKIDDDLLDTVLTDEVADNPNILVIDLTWSILRTNDIERVLYRLSTIPGMVVSRSDNGPTVSYYPSPQSGNRLWRRRRNGDLPPFTLEMGSLNLGSL